MKDPYPHQQQAVTLLRNALKAGKRTPILDCATGSGKTKIASDIFHMARGKGNRCLFVCDAIGLIDQTVQAFWDEGHRDIGVIQSNHPMTNYAMPIQVASIQTLARRRTPEYDLAVFDEAHVVYAEHKALIAASPTKPHIGLSGSPWTKGLGLIYDCLIRPVTMAELIAAGRVLPLVAYAPTNPDLSNVKIKAGDYDEAMLSIVMRDNKLVADVVETWRELGEGRSALGYAVDCAHGQHMQDRFNQAGLPSGYIDADTTPQDRKIARERLESGEYVTVWSVGTMIKGTDWKIALGIDCQPTKSHMRHAQKCGRFIRTRTGEAYGLMLDHAGNCLRLGMPVDIIRTELCTAKPSEKGVAEAQAAVLPKPCPQCGKLKTAKICVCGFESKRETDISEGAGQLARIDGGKAGPKKAEPTMFEKQEWYAQLRGWQIDKGKSDGWLAHAYKDKFGVWPRDMKNVLPMKVGGEVRNFITAKSIRYAKGMQAKQRRVG